MRKPSIGVSDQVRHKPGSTALEDGGRLEISDFRKMRGCTIIYVEKFKAPISCTNYRTADHAFVSHMQKTDYFMTWLKSCIKPHRRTGYI